MNAKPRREPRRPLAYRASARWRAFHGCRRPTRSSSPPCSCRPAASRTSGGRKVLLAGAGLFTLTSAVAACAPGLGVLVGARAVQAVGAAMIVPTSLGLLYPSFPKRQHTLVVGLWAGVGAIAASAGPPLGGLLVTIDWRWIFLINVPVGIVTLIAGALLLPQVRRPKGAALPDAASVLALLLAVSFLVLASVQGPLRGWRWRVREGVVNSADRNAGRPGGAPSRAARTPVPLPRGWRAPPAAVARRPGAPSAPRC